MTAAAANTFVTRAFTFAVPGDTLQTLADRVLPGTTTARGSCSPGTRT